MKVPLTNARDIKNWQLYHVETKARSHFSTDFIRLSVALGRSYMRTGDPPLFFSGLNLSCFSIWR